MRYLRRRTFVACTAVRASIGAANRRNVNGELNFLAFCASLFCSVQSSNVETRVFSLRKKRYSL